VSAFFWIVLGCTVLSGFFSLVSISLHSFRRVQLEEAFGGPDSPRLALMERHLPALQLTASFCRSLANLVLAVGMVYLLDAPRHGWACAIGAVAAAGAVIGVFGVAIPTAWASHTGERVLASTLPVMMFFRYLLYPVAAVLHAFDKPIRRLSGVAEHEEDDELAKQEILQAASEGQAEGVVEPEEVEMIESVMEFGETRAAEIMTPRTDIFALSVDTPWEEACRGAAEAGHSRVPVYQGDLDNIIGLLYAKDLLQHVGRGRKVDLSQVLRKPFFVPQTKLLDDLLREFKARKVHIAVVLDEYGGTAGLVTIEDVLEEIVGDISDEYDKPEPALMHRIDERSAEVDGRMYIDDLNEAMALAIPEDEDYDTVAGFVFSELGYIPAVGESLQSHGAKFTVLAANDRKISRLRVETPATARGRE
jgi:putative hemolysin